MERKDKREDSIWRNKAFILFSVILAGLFLIMLVQTLLPCHTMHYDGEITFETGVPVRNVSAYEGISLKPGVYFFDLSYETDQDLKAYCRVCDGTVITGGLLNNYEHFYRQLGKTDFEVWLFEKTDALQVCVTSSGEGELKVKDLTIRETKQLWTMLMTILVSLWGTVFACMKYRQHDRAGKISKDTKQVLFGLALLLLVTSYPFLFGFNISGADFTYHLQRIEGVRDGLMSGQFPVRLEPRWLYDHGYANAVFYCNFFLFFPAVLRVLGFPVSFSYNMYGIAVNLATIWIAYYSFREIFRNQKIGLTCTALYSLSIFRIYKFVITSAVGEGTAYTFLPLVLLGFYRFFTEDPKEKKYGTAWMPLCFGLVGVIHSHVLTCEITALMILLLCILYWKRVFVRETFLGLCRAAVSAFLLTAWFLVPFLDYYLTQDMHIKHVSARTIQESGLELGHLFFHFWKTGSFTPVSGYGLYQSHPVGIGLVVLLPAVLFCILWFSGKLQDKKDLLLDFVKKSAMLGVLFSFMSTNLFPWDQVQSLHPILASLVSSLQFPNRFLGWATVCMVTVFGYCLYYFSQRKRWQYLGLVLFAVIGMATSGVRLLEYACHDENSYELYNPAAMGYGYISGAEYLIEGTDYDLLTFSAAQAGPDVCLEQYEKKMLGAVFTCQNQGIGAESVDLPLLLYKGYQAKDMQTGEKLTVCAGENQLVRVILPEGYAGTVKVGFVSPLSWRIAEVISFTAFAYVLWGIWRNRRKTG